MCWIAKQLGAFSSQRQNLSDDGIVVICVAVVAASPDLRSMLGTLGFGVLLVVSAGLGAWFGYLHLLRRFQNQSRRENESESQKRQPTAGRRL